MQIARTLKRAKEPELTPLIDIVFQLVIFFMLTTSFVAAESLVLSLPGEDAGQSAQAPAGAMQIQISSTGHVTVDAQAVNREELEDLIILKLAKQPGAAIQLFSTPGVSMQQLVTVMDLVTLNGGKNLSVERLEYAKTDAAIIGEGAQKPSNKGR